MHTGSTTEYHYVFHYTDHLGNIRLSYGRDPETNEVAILKESHYYPFGLQHRGYVGDNRFFEQVLPIGRVNLIPVRNYLDDSYRYTFGGKEEQPELGLNWIDHHARNYDATLGRWMNVDPLAEKYPSISSFAYVANNPIYYIDPDGRKIIIHYQVDGENRTHNYKYGSSYDGDNKYLNEVYSALNYIIENDADFKNVIKTLAGDEIGDVNLFSNIKETNKLIDHPRGASYFDSEGLNTGGADIIWDSRKGVEFTNIKGLWSFITGKGYTEEGFVSPAEVLLHELGHAKNFLKDSDQYMKDHDQHFSGFTNKEEYNVIRFIENPASRKLGRKVIRKGHYGSFYNTVSPTSIAPKRK